MNILHYSTPNKHFDTNNSLNNAFNLILKPFDKIIKIVIQL